MSKSTQHSGTSHCRDTSEPIARPCATEECRGWVFPGGKCGYCGKRQPREEAATSGKSE